MENRVQLEKEIVEKAMRDPLFRKRLLENPRAVIEEETGITIPESVIIKIIEEEPLIIYLILPKTPVEHEET
ncbi:MAG: NHLP leader peptide family RiPP precursor [Bacteroidota bacterium]